MGVIVSSYITLKEFSLNSGDIVVLFVEVKTPLLQIEPSASADKDQTTNASMVRTKKRHQKQ